MLLFSCYFFYFYIFSFGFPSFSWASFGPTCDCTQQQPDYGASQRLGFEATKILNNCRKITRGSSVVYLLNHENFRGFPAFPSPSLYLDPFGMRVNQ